MKKDTTICIGTVGYPTFEKCYRTAKLLARDDPRIRDVVVIKNKYPTSAWLNEMRSYNQTTWVLQVDEDMYLYQNCLSELLKLAKQHEAKGVKVLNASGLLFDLFLKHNIGSIKLWNTECFQRGEFKNVTGSDRQFAKDVSKFGFRNVSVMKCLGQHDSAPSPEIAYFKYKEYLLKIRRFNDEKAAFKFLKYFKKLCDSHNTEISYYAYEGARAGMNCKLSNQTKDFRKNRDSREFLAVKKRLAK